jgi:RNase H-fold protein (predicted Holliday junction resolvase)
VGSIGGIPLLRPEVGVATSDGKAYYRISSLLKKINIPYVDIILGEQSVLDNGGSFSETAGLYLNPSTKVIITTRKERLRLLGPSVICVEDLGDDVGLAKEKLMSLIYSPKPSDWLVVGIDPGERTGVAAFINHREIESTVLHRLDETIRRVCEFLDNAPEVQKIVKVGAGNQRLALKIAAELDSRYKDRITIQLVDERGTSALTRRKNFASKTGTRDQRAAKLIAFREGQKYNRNAA